MTYHMAVAAGRRRPPPLAELLVHPGRVLGVGPERRPAKFRALGQFGAGYLLLVHFHEVPQAPVVLRIPADAAPQALRASSEKAHAVSPVPDPDQNPAPPPPGQPGQARQRADDDDSQNDVPILMALPLHGGSVPASPGGDVRGVSMRSPPRFLHSRESQGRRLASGNCRHGSLLS